jgi:hypothetical protein
MRKHTIMMLLACIFAGFLSTMNIWVYRVSDIRLHLNDVYMVGIMTGWMFCFMGLFMGDMTYALYGLITAGIFFGLIRSQLFITEKEYMRGMIPHHSMAIMMSKKMMKKPNNIQQLTEDIVKSQFDEINYMNRFLTSYY